MFSTTITTTTELNDTTTTTLTTTSASQSNVKSLQQSFCLELLLAFSQFEWRVSALWSSLFDIFLANMDHPYKSIRQKIGSCLSLSLVSRINYPGVSVDERQISHESRNLIKLVDLIDRRLTQSIELFDKLENDASSSNSSSNGDKQAESSADDTKELETQAKTRAVNFLQATFAWLSTYFVKSCQPINKQTLRLIYPVITRHMSLHISTRLNCVFVQQQQQNRCVASTKWPLKIRSSRRRSRSYAACSPFG